ncbi:phosphoribosylanthranilate isomerase [Thermococcus sp. M39]|uniref:phosphoribosylanthranilate isomerase n=1 Tax=unclassified Thermococcus TaxID=2627626 RepID=UPI00143B2E2C|nr:MULTISPECIES: phosphoribosylanthranilate isomerase [unclassified Thermococcus]NJE07484.1 phosphoribosylanthranilate isomerase [Thermococcus sp. M39]NJE12383.1 phosphoribosylanthranilate isomerase [Thermococcus sp. LS2]
MFVKICGIKSIEELRIVERYADATGVVVESPSRRKVPLSLAHEIIEESKISVFLVSTLEDFNSWSRVIEATEATHIQIHSRATPDVVERLKLEFGVFIMKAFKVPQFSNNPEADAEKLILEIQEYDVDRILLDTGAGTGELHDYRVSSIIARKFPVVIAGGLTPNNVSDVIKAVRPFGVDVSSGVEKNGRKDPELIEMFVRRVKDEVW